MKLQDIYDQLVYGEFRNISWGQELDDTGEGMPEESFMKLIPTVKLGLTELHKRFHLREEDFILPITPDKSRYILLSKVDAPDDFKNNLSKVERVYGIWQGRCYEIPLNKRDKLDSVRTPDYRSLVLPTDVATAPWLNETSSLHIFYRADHPNISVPVAVAAPLAVEIELPSNYLEALIWYMASRIANPAGSTEGFHEGNNYAAKFEAACSLLNTLNYEIDDDADEQRVMRNNWP